VSNIDFNRHSNKRVKIALLGCGVVGQGLLKVLDKNRRFPIEVSSIFVRSKKKREIPSLYKKRLVHDPQFVFRPRPDILVEVMGGIEVPQKFITRALLEGIPVVTANKAVLATHGKEIFSLAHKTKTPLLFEASVGGGIPIMKVLSEALQANTIYEIDGIVNGTSNYILTEMEKKHKEFSVILAEARALGYAEPDPRFDIHGIDALHKLVLLSYVALGIFPDHSMIYRKSLTDVGLLDILYAAEMGYRIKPLLILGRDKKQWERSKEQAANSKKQGYLPQKKNRKKPSFVAIVSPFLVPKHDFLAQVDGVFNVIRVKGDMVGETYLVGQGAGPLPTGSALFSDILDAMRKNTHVKSLPLSPHTSINNYRCSIYVRVSARDKPGVLKGIAGEFGSQGVSLHSVIQKEVKAGYATLVFLTHGTPLLRIHELEKRLMRLSFTRGKPVILPVLGAL